MKSKLIAVTLCLASLLSPLTYAQSLPSSYTVIAPTCLTQHGVNHKALASTDKFMLLQVDNQGLDQLIAAKQNQKNACGGFLNVTDKWNDSLKNVSPKDFLGVYTAPVPVAQATTHYAVNYTAEVQQLLTQLHPDNMWSNLTILTGFPDRSADSDYGVKAIGWVKDQVEQLVKNSGRTDVSLRFIKTGLSYKQDSLVVKIGNSNEAGIVIGSHIDTLNGAMPGADDDGTGTVTVLELANLLINSNMQFKKPIYLIWYAAEEQGLYGSSYTVADFMEQHIPVSEVLQLDMTGYTEHNDTTMWLVQDYTDDNLTAYLATLINTYVKQPIKYTSCGYACSDNASWNMNNFKVAFPSEEDIGHDNPYFHTAQDTMDKLSLGHMTDFAKLAVAFAVELAEPVKG